MIQTREDLRHYLETDKRVYGITRRRPALYGDWHWKFLIALRHDEYYHNSLRGGVLHKFKGAFWRVMHTYFGLKMGWDIPVNTFGPGLKINHFGLIVVHPNVRAGAFCDIHQGVNIGMHGDTQDDVPTLGENVWIGPGAKLFGRITIADRVAIGANAVVNRSFTTAGISIAGIPARKVSDTGNPYIKQ